MYLNSEDFLIIHESVKLVKGKFRSAIYDFQRNELYYIPNDLFSFITKSKNLKLSEIFVIYQDVADIITEYIEFLLERQLIFLGSNNDIKVLSSKENYNFNYWGLVTNLVYFHTLENEKFIDNITNSIKIFKSSAITIIFERTMNQKDIEYILNKFYNCSAFLIHVEVYCNYEINLEYDLMLNKYSFVNKILLYNSNTNNEELNDYGTVIIKTKIYSIDPKFCGINSIKHFTLNYDFFYESQKFNSCLNRKLAIDLNGDIKNCPSLTESFGNIRDTTLVDAVNKPGFKKYWDINKDKIHVCKFCEFRYVCTDCRAYVEDPDDILSKPLKCGYNPYTGEWSEWSTNPLKQKAIDFYGMREMVDEMKESEKQV